jgi:DNA-binding transcriptional ArsR family regulator
MDQTKPTTSADLEQLTSLLKLLGDPTRLNILMLLRSGERNVSNLCNSLGMPQPTVSHHLGLLRMSSVIVNRRSGKQVFYSLADPFSKLTESELQLAAPGFVVRIEPRQ